MDKQNVVYPYNGGIHSAIIEGIYSATKQNELSIHTHTHTHTHTNRVTLNSYH